MIVRISLFDHNNYFFTILITNIIFLSSCHHNLTKPFLKFKLLFHKDRLI